MGLLLTLGAGAPIRCAACVPGRVPTAGATAPPGVLEVEPAVAGRLTPVRRVRFGEVFVLGPGVPAAD